ncbi:LysR family transcriptional regulator [Pseudogemmobacter blasticus]|uniref:LysR family transcriptional regulator n=1 Tax=Fuscovulum blasticum DSM 2131 TaxID=1188250 RepID=A0A2T4J4Y4_FUSBL|nr:LysR family transcriptional regulator [Fuscovulum blasticum]PTE12898.1 LysR family transcriptional regulator [Fuscovulum blasticum DSM 2131]
MPRNLDLSALRSFVTVADVGGVTRAAGFLNLTQSAVSMQIKRLEDSLGQTLFLRAARKLALSSEGEQLLSYGRRMLALNDEVLSRFGAGGHEGELRLGVPHDIIYPAIPGILKRLAQVYPRVRVNLVSSFTLLLKEGFARGEFDAMVTTEEHPDRTAEVLSSRGLIWAGAPDGLVWQRRPLRLGFKDTCIFRPAAQAALDAAGIPWEMATGGESEQAVEATVAADLAVTVRMEGTLTEGMAPIRPEAGLPALGRTSICLYPGGARRDEVVDMLLSELRRAYSA